MKLATKLIITLAVVYNGAMGYAVTLTAQPFVVLGFLSLDFFLIFYYMWLLMKENLGTMKFARTHKELIDQAREEISKAKT